MVAMNELTKKSLLKFVYEARMEDYILSVEDADFKELLSGQEAEEQKEKQPKKIFFKGSELIKGKPSFSKGAVETAASLMGRKPHFWASWAKKVEKFSPAVIDLPEKYVYEKYFNKFFGALDYFFNNKFTQLEFIGNRANIAITVPHLNNVTNFSRNPGFYYFYGNALLRHIKVRYKRNAISSEGLEIIPEFNLIKAIEYIEDILSMNKVQKCVIGDITFWTTPALLFMYYSYMYYDLQIKIPDFCPTGDEIRRCFPSFVQPILPTTELIIVTTKNPALLSSIFYLSPYYNYRPTVLPNENKKIGKIESKYSFLENKEVFPVGTRSVTKWRQS
jgi:hypothetical protein